MIIGPGFLRLVLILHFLYHYPHKSLRQSNSQHPNYLSYISDYLGVSDYLSYSKVKNSIKPQALVFS